MVQESADPNFDLEMILKNAEKASQELSTLVTNAGLTGEAKPAQPVSHPPAPALNQQTSED